MGACCNGKESKHDRNEEEIYTKNTRSLLLTEHTKNAKPKIELDVEKTNLNQLLTGIILKYSTMRGLKNITLNKLCIEQLWNICKLYLDDFTNSDYILLDLRKNEKKKENFLKKFKSINYSIDEMKLMNETSINKFRRYLELKNVIIIMNDDLIKNAEEVIEFMNEKKINARLYLYDHDHNLNEAELNNNNFLYETLDSKLFNYFPYIMLSLRFFPHLKSENYIFFDFIKKGESSSSKFNQEFFSNPKNKDTNVVKFYKNFNSSTILKINENTNNMDFNNYGIKNFNSNINSLVCKFINVSGLNSIIDIENRKKELFSIIDIIKCEVISNKSVFILIEESINIEVVVYLIFLFIWRITDIAPKSFNSYIVEHFIFIKDIKSYCQKNIDKIDEFLLNKFKISNSDLKDKENENVFEYNNENTDNIDENKKIEDKVNFKIKLFKIFSLVII